MLKFETLERKDLLAGDVAAFIDGTTAHIQGDNEANVVVVEGGPTEALWIRGAQDTTINGASGFLLLLPHDIDHIMVDLGSGADAFEMYPLSFYNDYSFDLTIDLGHGGYNPPYPFSERVQIGLGVYPGDLTIIGGDQEESIFFESEVEIYGNLDIRTGSGADWVRVFGPTIHGTTYIDVAQNGLTADRIELAGAVFHDNVTVLAGQGNDFVSIRYCTFYADVGIYGEQGRHDAIEFTNNTWFGTLTLEGFEIV